MAQLNTPNFDPIPPKYGVFSHEVATPPNAIDGPIAAVAPATQSTRRQWRKRRVRRYAKAT